MHVIQFPSISSTGKHFLSNENQKKASNGTKINGCFLTAFQIFYLCLGLSCLAYKLIQFARMKNKNPKNLDDWQLSRTPHQHTETWTQISSFYTGEDRVQEYIGNGESARKNAQRDLKCNDEIVDVSVNNPFSTVVGEKESSFFAMMVKQLLDATKVSCFSGHDTKLKLFNCFAAQSSFHRVQKKEDCECYFSCLRGSCDACDMWRTIVRLTHNLCTKMYQTTFLNCLKFARYLRPYYVLVGTKMF